MSRLSSLALVSPAWYRPVLRQHLPCLFMCLSSLFVFCSEEGRSEGYTAEEAKVIQRKKRRLYRGRSEDYTEEEAMFIQRKKRRVGLYLHVAEKLFFFLAAKVIQRKKQRNVVYLHVAVNNSLLHVQRAANQ